MFKLKNHLLFLLCLISTLSNTQEIVYVSGDEDGQGVLRRHKDNCYLISPMHVIGFSSEIAITNSMRNKVIATMEGEYPPDISISKLYSPTSCLTDWPSSIWIKNTLNKIENAAIVSRQADGSLKRRFVVITEFDDRNIRVRPHFQDESLFQGLSGSALIHEGKLIGQLMSIDANSNTGNVLRQDFIDGILKTRFGEGRINYKGINLNDNIISNKWKQFGNKQNRGKITIDDKDITIKYSGSGNNQINIGIKQIIPVDGLTNLRLSYHAKSSTFSDDGTSFVAIMLSFLDAKGKPVASLLSSPDKYLNMKIPTIKKDWIEGKNNWNIDNLYRQIESDNDFQQIELSIFNLTPKQERCSRCKLEINDLRLYFEN